MKPFILLGLSGLLLHGTAMAAKPQMSGGVDLRYENRNGNKHSLRVEGVFLNMRKVFSDQEGDRLITVGQIDWDDNFDRLRPYQTYAQYKGPLGKWNLSAGHFILPYGLLSDYDTERLLLQTQELKALGIKLDTGLKCSGRFRTVDYAFSVTQGVGRTRLEDADGNKLVTGRIGWAGNDVSTGFSILNGKVLIDGDDRTLPVYERRAGFDLTKYSGPTTVRGELTWGRNNGQTTYSGYFGMDHALSTKVEVNFKYAYWQGNATEHFLGVGFSYNLWARVILRAADEYQFSQRDQNAFSLQVYWDFLKIL